MDGRVGRACAITDLPGYGFAKVSRDMQDSWKKNIEGYMKRREQLRLSVLLVDAQREPSELDASLESSPFVVPSCERLAATVSGVAAD